ncbi:Leukocyte elastase inhibitor A [Bulinus truncatus]|nr:Leukocyte elastase inhibitor A [Bulinus truncatus]
MSHELISAANNKFGLDLFKLFHDGRKGENLFLSPFSISVALAMTQVGAKEKTALDMAKTLRWETEDEIKIHEQFQDYIKLIQSPTDAYELSTANRIYLQQSYIFLEEFKNKVVNWYLAGQWETKFKESDTKPLPFKVSPGQTKNVPKMTITHKYSYTEDVDLKITAIEIPYKGKHLGMVILLPDEDFGLENVINNLSCDKLKIILKICHFQEEKQNLHCQSLSKSTNLAYYYIAHNYLMTTSMDLKPLLSSLGMEDAFNMNCADFSGITGGKDLHISAAIHKAFIQVNEEGTEAAADTAVRVCNCGPTAIAVDHPFLFLIRDIRTNNILFLGQVTDPSS